MERSKVGMEDNKQVYYTSVIQQLGKELGSPPANISQLDINEGIIKERSNKEKEFRT
jgi:hypothetical protein